MESLGVLGVGRLGICTALVLEKAGFNVICYDVNKATCDAINNRSIESPEKGVSQMLSEAKHIQAVYSLQDMMHLDTFFCVVATPSLADGSYNHQYVDAVAEELISLLSKPGVSRKLLNICCTTMPGYCDTLQAKFNEHDIPVDVCYNPEFIAQGDIINGFYNPDILLIGEANEACGNKLESIYKNFVKSQPHICRMTRKEAEITKIAINCFITTKISFANTLGDLCVASDCNQDRVLKAIGLDSRIGTKYFRWGFGYGGPCFPRDNRALCLYARGQGVNHLIGESTDRCNQTHRDFLVSKIIEMKGDKEIVLRDLAYKPGTVIIEESQSLAVALELVERGNVVYIDESDEMVKVLKQQYGHKFFYGLPEGKEIFLIDNNLKFLKSQM